MTARPEYEPVLTGDPAANTAVLAELTAARPPGVVRLPPGTHPLAAGLVLDAGWTLVGAPPPPGEPVGSWLSGQASGAPLVHVTGSDVQITGLGLLPAPAAPGEHAGDRGTAVTIGNYLYADQPRWIERIRLHDVHVRRPGEHGANCVAVMGAVRDVQLTDVSVVGGCTGLAVHWGAAGGTVATLSGPTYHPHRLSVANLRVSDAFEGFYLSSVHAVRVAGFCLAGVEIGFRLLAGDNTDRRHPGEDRVVGGDIDISGGCVAWHGHLYGLRVAGWGRSEVDGLVSTLAFRDATIRDVALTALDTAAPGQQPSPPPSPPPRSPVVLEAAHGVALRNVHMRAGPAAEPCCALRGP